MLRITAIISLLFIVSSVWSACDSCGSECASACGTRRFRSCCFNYLRKKRGPEMLKMQSLTQDMKESQPGSRLPLIIVESIPMPEQWFTNVLSNENHPYSLKDLVENRLDIA